MAGAIAAVAWSSAAIGAEAIGSITRVAGAAVGVVDGARQTLAAGNPVYLGEAIATGADGRLAVTLADGTALTVGENANLTVDTFVYNPAGANSLHAAVAGAFRFVFGHLNEGAVRTASVTTPAATIGVRGTDFWGGPIDGGNGFLLIDGAIDVTVNGTSVAIDNAGTGVTFSSGAAQPGMVSVWPTRRWRGRGRR
ncbi:MAG: FecR domain-containing protein [Bauldia sp.]